MKTLEVIDNALVAFGIICMIVGVFGRMEEVAGWGFIIYLLSFVTLRLYNKAKK